MGTGFHKINELTRLKIPYFFIIDFTGNIVTVLKLDETVHEKIFFAIGGCINYSHPPAGPAGYSFSKHPPGFARYRNAFNRVLRQIKAGNTYLLNLTFRSEIKTSLSLTDIFMMSKARYKLFYKNKFVVFSPETFIRIRGNTISAFPMKGTIDASVPNAQQVILNDRKEHAEHATIVDLLRNDLSMVASDVKVKRFRYVEQVITQNKTLLQVSSEIVGTLLPRFRNRFGDILRMLLPAGSVTGAPKKKTVEIIRNAENYRRGFFTGVFGIFTGRSFESAVMIRFVEKIKGKLFFKSGGGITSFSNPAKEFRELVDKIYLPIY